MKKKQTFARRAATLLAALGVLVMSSGVALMVTATPANAGGGHGDDGDGRSICHPVNGRGELGNGWDLIGPDHASSHIDESDYPDGTYWKHTSKDGRHDMYAEDGTCPGDQIPPTVCPKGTDHAGDEVPDGSTAEEFCNDEVVTPTEVSAAVTFTEPTCTTAAAYTGTDTDKVTYAVTSGSVAPGASVTVTATANSGFTLAGPTTFTHTFVTPTGCSSVSPPTLTSVSPPKAHTTKTHVSAPAAAVTPTVVHAGLAGTTVQDVRGEQGLALLVAGMVILVGAGGLRLGGRSSRI